MTKLRGRHGSAFWHDNGDECTCARDLGSVSRRGLAGPFPALPSSSLHTTRHILRRRRRIACACVNHRQQQHRQRRQRQPGQSGSGGPVPASQPGQPGQEGGGSNRDQRRVTFLRHRHHQEEEDEDGAASSQHHCVGRGKRGVISGLIPEETSDTHMPAVAAVAVAAVAAALLLKAQVTTSTKANLITPPSDGRGGRCGGEGRCCGLDAGSLAILSLSSSVAKVQYWFRKQQKLMDGKIGKLASADRC